MNFDDQRIQVGVQQFIDEMTPERLQSIHKAWLRSRSFLDLFTGLTIRLLPAIVAVAALVLIYMDLPGDWTLLAAMLTAIGIDIWYVRDSKKRFHRDLLIAINIAVIHDLEKGTEK